MKMDDVNEMVPIDDKPGMNLRSPFQFSTSAKGGAEDSSNLGLVHGNIDIGKLTLLFNGNHQNVEYFLGLWKVMKSLSEVECKNVYCDPRDERKCEEIANWKPSVRTSGHKVELESESFLPDACGLAPEGLFAVKQTVLDKDEPPGMEDVSDDASGDGDKKRFHCGVHGCGEVLTSLSSYEAHYHHCHNYVCDACRRVFVSDFLLDIHLEENHDSYFAVLCPRMDMYRCLVQSCPEKFRTPELRKNHVVVAHNFPSNFSFHQPIKQTGSRQVAKPDLIQVQLPLDNHNKALDPASPVVESDAIAMDTECSVNKSNSRKKGRPGNEASVRGKRVPATVCFGRGSQRAFQHQRRGRGRGRNWYQTGVSMETDTSVNIETVDMKDLAEALR